MLICQLYHRPYYASTSSCIWWHVCDIVILQASVRDSFVKSAAFFHSSAFSNKTWLMIESAEMLLESLVHILFASSGNSSGIILLGSSFVWKFSVILWKFFTLISISHSEILQWFQFSIVSICVFLGCFIFGKVILFSYDDSCFHGIYHLT